MLSSVRPSTGSSKINLKPPVDSIMVGIIVVGCMVVEFLYAGPAGLTLYN